MNYTELSIENIKELSKKLASKIESDSYNPDMVIFLKEGGAMLGYEVAKNLNIPVEGIKVSRKGNKLKECLSGILGILPQKIKFILRNIEFNSGFHKKNSKRECKGIDELQLKGDNILIVDDSVDTGYSVKALCDAIKKKKCSVNLKVAALNKFSQSDEVVKTDYYIYLDSIIVYPWSKDSREYNQFLKEKNKYNLK